MRRLCVLACALLVLVLPRSLPALAADVEAPEAVLPPEVTAAGAVLWDPADDRVLYGRDEATPRPMASTTKIMTVLLAVEADSMADTVTVSPQAAALGGATLHLEAGQRVGMESLLAGLLLESGNDAAVAVAEHVAGSEAAFVERMNERAGELGLTGTRFTDPHGLNTDPAHRASPLDLARLAHVTLQHDVIARFARMPTATVPGLPALANRNELLDEFPWATGVKTGYTSLAGYCLVASAEHDGRTLYAVVLASDARFAEAQALLEYGFAAFRRAEPVAAGGAAVRYRWADAAVATVVEDGLGATVPAGAQVTWRTRLHPVAARPLAAGAALGRAELWVDGEVVDDAPLVAAGAVGPPPAAAPAARAGGALQEALRAFARLAEIDRET